MPSLTSSEIALRKLNNTPDWQLPLVAQEVRKEKYSVSSFTKKVELWKNENCKTVGGVYFGVRAKSE